MICMIFPKVGDLVVDAHAAIGIVPASYLLVSRDKSLWRIVTTRNDRSWIAIIDNQTVERWYISALVLRMGYPQ